MNARTNLLAILTLSLAAALPAWAQSTRTPTPPRPAATKPAAVKTTTQTPAKAPAKPAPTAPVSKTNPLLPPAIPVDSFNIDINLVQKLPAIAPAGVDPLYTPADWKAFQSQFGAEAEKITQLKSTGQAAFAQKLLTTAIGPESTGAMTDGLRRLLILRAASIAWRSKDGFPVADKAIAAYQTIMDKKSPMQVGALWTLANTMSRTSVLTKEDRIRYDGIAARANMQLSLILLDADQITAADAMIKQIGYHEGWLKKDTHTRSLIAQVRAEVKQQTALMDYLSTQYQPAMKNDVKALTAFYLYGRYVKTNTSAVADLPHRAPNSALAQLAASIDAVDAQHPARAFVAGENLRIVSGWIPDPLIRQRTLYAALKMYDIFLAAPETERDRVNRTLARIAREGVVSDGARKAHSIDPFAPPAGAATMPAVAQPTPAPRPARPVASPPQPVRPDSLDGTPEHPRG